MKACKGGDIGMGTPEPPTPPGIFSGPWCRGTWPGIRATPADGPDARAGERIGGEAERGEMGD